MATESFEDMFDTLVREKPDGAAPAPAAPATPTTVAPPPDPATPQPTAQEPPTPAAGDPATPEPTEIEAPDPAEPVPEPEPQPQPQPSTDEALARLADILSQRQQAQPQPQPQPQPQAPPVFNQDEVALLTQYQQDYPDVVKAEALIRRQEYRILTEHIFRQVTEYLAPQLALLGQVADTTAYGQLSSRVPDYDQHRDAVVDWVKTQPDYLQAGMNHVIQHGTVEQIVDLFDRYRQAAGVTSPTPNPGIAPRAQEGRQTNQPSTEAPELSPQAKQAAQRLAPVSSKRSAPTQAAPATFEDAFEQFAKTIS